MVFNTGSALLDAIVLAVVSKETYDLAIDGRNRPYYRITERGRAQLNLYKGEWSSYSKKISHIFEEARV